MMTPSRKGAIKRPLLVVVLLVLGLMMMVLVTPVDARTKERRITLCIKNCGQCKTMYGDHFQGGMCADACLKSNGHLMLDCGVDDPLVSVFLDRME